MSENTFATNFNNVLKTLSRTYVSKKKGTFDEEKSIRNNKRLILLTQTDPMFLLINAGPVLLKYQSTIASRDWDSLMQCDFKEEKNQHAKQAESKTVDNEIEFIKQTFKMCSKEEKKQLGDLVQSLLKTYLLYRIDKNNRNKENLKRN